MKQYNVTVNGNVYNVTVEEVGANAAPAPVSAPAVKPATAPVAAPSANVSGTKITAPMPGTIVSIDVNVGDSVAKGQKLFVLEAMKMENDIVSTADGKVLAINAKKGDSVNASDAVIVIG